MLIILMLSAVGGIHDTNLQSGRSFLKVEERLIPDYS